MQNDGISDCASLAEGALHYLSYTGWFAKILTLNSIPQNIKFNTYNYSKSKVFISNADIHHSLDGNYIKGSSIYSECLKIEIL